MSIAIGKKTSMDERSFVQFIIALRQIKAIVPELRRTMSIILRSFWVGQGKVRVMVRVRFPQGHIIAPVCIIYPSPGTNNYTDRY